MGGPSSDRPAPRSISRRAVPALRRTGRAFAESERIMVETNGQESVDAAKEKGRPARDGAGPPTLLHPRAATTEWPPPGPNRSEIDACS